MALLICHPGPLLKRACCDCPDLSHFSNAMIALTARGLSWSYFRFNGWDLKTRSFSLGRIMTPFTIFRYISLKCAVTRRISVPCIDRHQASWAFHCPSCASMHELVAWLKSSATSWASDSSLNFLSSSAPCFSYLQHVVVSPREELLLGYPNVIMDREIIYFERSNGYWSNSRWTRVATSGLENSPGVIVNVDWVLSLQPHVSPLRAGGPVLDISVLKHGKYS